MYSIRRVITVSVPWRPTRLHKLYSWDPSSEAVTAVGLSVVVNDVQTGARSVRYYTQGICAQWSSLQYMIKVVNTVRVPGSWGYVSNFAEGMVRIYEKKEATESAPWRGVEPRFRAAVWMTGACTNRYTTRDAILMLPEYYGPPSAALRYSSYVQEHNINMALPRYCLCTGY